MTSVARADFIAAMRTVANSVSVVTTDGVAGRYGATVSAFCSVSADPPAVLVCLHADSRIAHHVAANGCFCVNVLPESAANLAERFAGKQDAQLPDRFDGLRIDAPLPELPGATAITCNLGQTMREGSHLVCIGKVTGITLGHDVPLTYLAGRYNALSHKEVLP